MTNSDPSRVVTDYQLVKLAQAIEHFRTYDKEIPAQVIATFLYVASHDDCLKSDLEKELMFSTASGSRNTDWLSDFHRLNKAGLGLITKQRDPLNRRRHLLKLSPKGRILAKQLKQILYGSQTI